MEVLNSEYDAHSSVSTGNRNLQMGIGSDLVNHANRLGIKLRSAGKVRPTQTSISERLSARRVATALGNCRTWDVMNDWSAPPSSGHPQTYVHNVVIPLQQAQLDEENLQRSISRQSLSGTQKSTLPQMRQNSAKSNRSLSLYLDRYTSSTPSELQVLKESKSNQKKLWNTSGQALRFQHEQENKKKSRTLQRTSVIQPHRLDRMYYISGTQVSLDSKYEVDSEEMLKLKDMAKVRQEATHYGRGLSSEKRKLIGSTANEDIQIPRNPPNSQSDLVKGYREPSVTKQPQQQENTQTKVPPIDTVAQANENHNSESLEGFALKGVGIDGGTKTNHSFTVHVVNEDNLRTPHNSARTEQTVNDSLLNNGTQLENTNTETPANTLSQNNNNKDQTQEENTNSKGNNPKDSDEMKDNNTIPDKIESSSEPATYKTLGDKQSSDERDNNIEQLPANHQELVDQESTSKENQLESHLKDEIEQNTFITESAAVEEKE